MKKTLGFHCNHETRHHNHFPPQHPLIFGIRGLSKPLHDG